MTVLDQDDVDQEEEDDLQLDQEDDVEHDRQVRGLEERLRRLSIVGEPEFIVAGNLDEGYSVDIPESGGGEEVSGACCTSGTCTIETEEDCTGFYLGDNTTCDGIDCAVGACCTDGVCTITTEADCAGTYEGDGTDCDPNPCPPAPPTGACCVDTVCSIETESHCVDIGGTYQGDDTDCDPNPCADTGACCVGGICSITTEADCHGTYRGNGTVCDPNPCLEHGQGACCHGTSCDIETSAACSGTGGDYHGDGSTCSPDPCTAPSVNCPCGFEAFDGSGRRFKTKTSIRSDSCNWTQHECIVEGGDCLADENCYLSRTEQYDPVDCTYSDSGWSGSSSVHLYDNTGGIICSDTSGVTCVDCDSVSSICHGGDLGGCCTETDSSPGDTATSHIVSSQVLCSGCTNLDDGPNNYYTAQILSDECFPT